jgi:hypothetical protein
METRMVKTGDLSTFIQEELTRYKTLLADCEKILEHVQDLHLKGSITKKVNDTKVMVEGLEHGYVPVLTGWNYAKTDTKDRWRVKVGRKPRKGED